MTDISDFRQIPKPGEPLQPKVHEDNVRAEAEALARRIELIKAKLSRRQLWQLERRYWQLHRKLTKAKYNALVARRDALAQEYTMLRASYRQKPSQKLKAHALKIARQGKATNAQLERLAPFAHEFEQVAQRLANHYRVIQFEREESENRKALFREANVWEQQMYAVFRQSPRLHHIDNSRKEPRTVIPKIRNVTIKPDRVYFEIKTTSQGLIDKLQGVWKSALPYGVDVADLVSEETLANLTAACGRIVSVERSHISQNIWYVINRLDAADGIPNKVLYEQVIEHYPTEKHLSTPFPAGLGADLKIKFFDFEEYPNVLVAGSAGGGKSNFINQMVSTLITMNSPEELQVLFIDNKGGIELSHFDGIPHQIAPVVKTIDDVVPTLKIVRELMLQRYAAFLPVKARKLTEFNKKSATKLPRVVVIIDEMATLVGLGKLTDEIHTELRAISSQGRAAGIHLVICTQHPSVDVLPGWVKTNMSLRISGRMPNHTASQIIVDSVTASLLPDIPGRMVFRRGGFELVLQTPLIEDTGMAHAVSIAKEFQATQDTLAVAPVSSTPVAPKFGRDDYLKVVIEQLGGRLSPARVHEIVGNAVMSLTELRKLGQQVREEIQGTQSKLTFEGTTYHMHKERNTYVLLKIEPTEAPTEQESGSSLDTEKLFSCSVHSVEEIEDENAILEPA